MKITATIISVFAALFAGNAFAAFPTAVNSQITDSAVGVKSQGSTHADHGSRSHHDDEHGRRR